MGARIDLTDKKFGRLTVIARCGTDRSGNVQWLCECICGTVKAVSSNAIRGGRTVSCGCYHKDKVSEASKTHGGHRKRLYGVWRNMKSRCNNSNTPRFYNYGGRGIKICDEWYDFAVFEKWAMDNGYNPTAKKGQCTIERKDNSGNYEPDNCRWTDMTQQNLNRRLTDKNKSGYIGICRDKRTGKWDASLRAKGKLIFRRLFKDREEAIAARKAAEDEFWKDLDATT